MHTIKAFHLLCSHANEEEKELTWKYSSPLVSGSVEKRDSEYPIIYSFGQAERPLCFLKSTNYYICKTDQVYMRFHDFVIMNLNTENAQRTKVTSKYSNSV